MSERTSENLSPISDQAPTVKSANSGARTLKEYAADVIDAILTKNQELTVMITDCNGKVLTSTLNKRETRENVGNILSFTDKCKFLVRKLLNEDLVCVRIKGTSNEIVVTFDEDQLEIITIQEDDESRK